jgi:hypothetical protein
MGLSVCDGRGSVTDRPAIAERLKPGANVPDGQLLQRLVADLPHEGSQRLPVNGPCAL